MQPHTRCAFHVCDHDDHDHGLAQALPSSSCNWCGGTPLGVCWCRQSLLPPCTLLTSCIALPGTSPSEHQYIHMLLPTVKWAQRPGVVYLTIDVQDTKGVHARCVQCSVTACVQCSVTACMQLIRRVGNSLWRTKPSTAAFACLMPPWPAAYVQRLLDCGRACQHTDCSYAS